MRMQQKTLNSPKTKQGNINGKEIKFQTTEHDKQLKQKNKIGLFKRTSWGFCLQKISTKPGVMGKAQYALWNRLL